MTWYLIDLDMEWFDTNSLHMASEQACMEAAEFWQKFADDQIFWFCLGYV